LTEISPQVIDDVIVDVFRTLYHSHTAIGQDFPNVEESKKARQELLKSANLLFATFEVRKKSFKAQCIKFFRVISLLSLLLTLPAASCLIKLILPNFWVMLIVLKFLFYTYLVRPLK